MQGHAYAHFVASLPYFPRATDDFRRGVYGRSPSAALTRRYIEPERPYQTAWLKLDMDSAEAGAAWIDHSGARPHFIVGNPANGHAHYLYGLKSPVVKSESARPHPLRFMAAVEAGLTRVLGADPRYPALFCKTPFHPDWYTLSYDGPLYDLADLLDSLPASVSTRKVSRQEYVGEGRNCDLFTALRYWAYGQARAAKASGDYARWTEAVARQAADLNRFDVPLYSREVQSVARSVARWTWQNADGLSASVLGGAKRSKVKSWNREAITPDQAKERMREGGKHGAQITNAIRRNRTFDAITAALGQLAAQGIHKPSVTKIAQVAGVSRETVYQFRRSAGQAGGGN